VPKVFLSIVVGTVVGAAEAFGIIGSVSSFLDIGITSNEYIPTLLLFTGCWWLGHFVALVWEAYRFGIGPRRILLIGQAVVVFLGVVGCLWTATQRLLPRFHSVVLVRLPPIVFAITSGATLGVFLAQTIVDADRLSGAFFEYKPVLGSLLQQVTLFIFNLAAGISLGWLAYNVEASSHRLSPFDQLPSNVLLYSGGAGAVTGAVFGLSNEIYRIFAQQLLNSNEL